MVYKLYNLLVISSLVAIIGCVDAPPPAAEPPLEETIRVAFAQFAISLAQSGFACEPDSKVLLKPAVNRAATQMYSESKPKELVPFALQQDFAAPLIEALCNTSAYQGYFDQLQTSHPKAWKLLAELRQTTPDEFVVPALEQPCWNGVTRVQDRTTRYAVTISCRQETEREDTHHARNVLAFHFRLVDLQTAEVLLTFTEKIDRAWKRSAF